MGASGFVQQCSGLAMHDLRAWAKEHVRQTSIALVAALLGVPAYLLLSGAALSALKEQLVQVAAYSVAGPASLILVAYVYFLVRAPASLYRERTSELRELRIKQGLSTADLDPKPRNRRWLHWLSLYWFQAIIGASLVFLVVLIVQMLLVQISAKRLSVEAKQEFAEIAIESKEIAALEHESNQTAAQLRKMKPMIDRLIRSKDALAVALVTLCKREHSTPPECALLNRDDIVPKHFWLPNNQTDFMCRS